MQFWFPAQKRCRDDGLKGAAGMTVGVFVGMTIGLVAGVTIGVFVGWWA